jgi:hypothetical protein
MKRTSSSSPPIWLLRALLVESFSSSFTIQTIHSRNNHRRRQLLDRRATNQKHTTIGDTNNKTLSEISDVDISKIDEGQVLLACRSYLRRKHKLIWEEKKRREEAAASPLFNEGYFWYDPNELIYLRENPDPYNLIDNETFSEYAFNYTYNEGVLLDGDSIPLAENRVETSTNPFSTNPLYPSDEHVRRSNSRDHLWRNETWRELWYEKRWKGRIITDAKKKQRNKDKLLGDIPSNILDSPTFGSLSEEEVAEAIVSYLQSNQRKSEARKLNKRKKMRRREEFREWRTQIQQNAEAVASDDALSEFTMKDVIRKAAAPLLSSDPLSFEPSVDKMKKLRSQRGERAKQAFQMRLENSKANVNVTSKKKLKFRRSYSEGYNTEYRLSADDEDAANDEVSPVQALLRIDEALDDKKLPSNVDVETILKPGRLGRRRDILRRILNECFDLRGKCVPQRSELEAMNGTEDELLFVTKCTISELGLFVLAKLRDKI